MKNQTKILIIIAAVLGVACILVGMIGMFPTNSNQPVYSDDIVDEDVFHVVVPWEEEDAKQPVDYTKEEYEQLSPAQKDKFQNSFENDEVFINWAEKENVRIERYPWQLGGKKPSEYTLKEYEALTDQQKVGFKLYFGVAENFEAWLKSAQEYEKLAPWETGGKHPSEYTLEEYFALSDLLQQKFQSAFEDTESFDSWFNQVTADYASTMPWINGGKLPSEYTLAEYKQLKNLEQLMFQKWFDTIEDYDAWLLKAELAVVEKNPWETGGKKPNEYTLEEFNKLTASQQIAFQKWFGSSGKFDEWMKNQQTELPKEEKNPWETGGKKPSEYTLAEFNALSASQQIAFQKWFGSDENFDAWLSKVEKESFTPVEVPWEKGGKSPDQYTLTEFNELTGEQQIAFQKWFGSGENFDAWMKNAQQSSEDQIVIPWQNGGKHPSEYTWDEFEGLSGPLQIMFQEELGPEAFESWMNFVTGNE